MVHIRVGKHLDVPACELSSTALGELTVGPLRLLSWLESQLGLKLPEVSFTSRMVQYLACLKRAAPGRFYERSLAQDDFGTARTLLQWRDTWYEAGWSGVPFPENASARLRDMAAVESLAAPLISLNTGQRAQRAVTELAASPLSFEVTLLDAPESFPKVWEALFIALGAKEEPLALNPQAPESTDLGKIQRALTNHRTPGEKLDLTGDGSFIVLRDGSPQLSAPWVARFAHGHNETNGSVAILASNHGSTLDDALTDAGFPRLGFADASYWRPVFQVLPLAIELIWRPLDPTVLLQFLTHPMGPIRANIRRPLAAIVARQPGIGGETFKGELEVALDNAVAEEPDESRAAKRTELAAGVSYWLESERHDAQAGAPVELLLERTRRVSQWLAKALAALDGDDAEAALYAAALGQADELASSFERLGDAGSTTLARISVRRLIEAVRGMGSSRPGRPAQCAAGEPQLLSTNTPAGFIAPVPKVIWWACDGETLPRQYPWSRAERMELASFGVELVPLKTQLSWQASSWLRPILSAEQQLLLVLHDNADGHHPIFDEILAIAEGWAECRVDELMRDPGRIPAGDSLPQTELISPCELPAKTRWWHLPQDLVFAPREQESFSSLEKFLFAPHRWVLEYQARIRPGTLEEIGDGALLKGNLAHALFEAYFNAHPDVAGLDANQAKRWARDNAAFLIEQQGAVLLTPGRQAEKEHFIGTVSNALTTLVNHLQAARVTSVAMETELNAQFPGGKLGGTVDLIATKATGEVAILDLKWGGFKRRQQMLAEGNYLQLAIYGQLLKQNQDKWPALGYFIVSDARLAVLATDFFPDAVIEQPVNGENLLEFWQRVVETWTWRRTQLEQGLVEVPVTGTEPDELSDPGEFGLPMPETFDQYDDYGALTGWSRES